LPGGGVLFGETCAEAVSRELGEEFGMIIQPIQSICVTDHILPIERQHWVAQCFFAVHISGEPTIREPGKCIDIGWFELDELPDPLMSVSESCLRAYVANVVKVSSPSLKE
jgi:8-oxo-dGTP diphosphatase